MTVFPSCYVVRSPTATVVNGRLVVDRAGGKARLVRDAPLNKKVNATTHMITATRTWRRALCVVLASAAISACGGGGGGGGSSAPPPLSFSDASFAGLWQGPLTSTGGTTQRVFSLILAPDGRFT